MTEDKKTADQLSAQWQVSRPDFCGVDMKAHEAYLAGYNEGVKESLDRLLETEESSAKQFERAEKLTTDRQLLIEALEGLQVEMRNGIRLAKDEKSKNIYEWYLNNLILTLKTYKGEK